MEDEWDRQLEEDEPLDVLFVAYQPERISVDTMLDLIQREGFDANVKEAGDSAP